MNSKKNISRKSGRMAILSPGTRLLMQGIRKSVKQIPVMAQTNSLAITLFNKDRHSLSNVLDLLTGKPVDIKDILSENIEIG